MNVTCSKCGRVYFEVSRKKAEDEVRRFNKYYRTLDDEGKKAYGNSLSCIGPYEYCALCGSSYKTFREFKEDDCPIGCTLSPIIRKED